MAPKGLRINLLYNIDPIYLSCNFIYYPKKKKIFN